MAFFGGCIQFNAQPYGLPTDFPANQDEPALATRMSGVMATGAFQHNFPEAVLLMIETRFFRCLDDLLFQLGRQFFVMAEILGVQPAPAG